MNKKKLSYPSHFLLPEAVKIVRNQSHVGKLESSISSVLFVASWGVDGPGFDGVSVSCGCVMRCIRIRLAVRTQDIHRW